MTDFENSSPAIVSRQIIKLLQKEEHPFMNSFIGILALLQTFLKRDKELFIPPDITDDYKTYLNVLEETIDSIIKILEIDLTEKIKSVDIERIKKDLASTKNSRIKRMLNQILKQKQHMEK